MLGDKLLSQWGKFSYVAVFHTTRNSHFPEKNLLTGSHSRGGSGRGGGVGDCYLSWRKYHYIANFPMVRFSGSGIVRGKLLSQWGKFGNIVFFPTTWNRLNLFQKTFVG